MRVSLIAIFCLLPIIGCKSEINKIGSNQEKNATNNDDLLVEEPNEELTNNVQSIDAGILKAGPQAIGEDINPADDSYIHDTQDPNYPKVLPREYTGPTPIVDVGNPVDLHWQVPEGSSTASLVVYPAGTQDPKTPVDITNGEPLNKATIETNNYVPGHYMAELNYTRADGGENTHYFPFVVRPVIDLTTKTPEIFRNETGSYSIYSPHGADSIIISANGHEVDQRTEGQRVEEIIDVEIKSNDATDVITISGYLTKNGIRSRQDQTEIRITQCEEGTFACIHAQVQKRCADIGKENWLGNASENMKVDFISRKNINQSCSYSSAQDTLDANGNFGRVQTGYRVITARWPLDPNAHQEGCTQPANMPDPSKFYVCDFEVVSYDRFAEKPLDHKIKVHDQGGLTLGTTGSSHYVFSHMVKGMVDKLNRTAESDLPVYDWSKITTNTTTGQRAPFNINNVNAPPKFNGGSPNLPPVNVDQMPSRQTPASWNYEANDAYAQILFSQLYVDGVTPNTLNFGLHTYGDGNESDFTRAKDCNVSGVSNNVEGEAKFRMRYWYVPISD